MEGKETVGTWFQICIAIICAFAAMGSQARGATTNLTPVADTFMRDSAPDMNFGGNSPLLVGIAKDFGPPQNRVLMKFDLTQLPTNAIITNVTLTIIVTRSNTEESYFDLNRMLVEWDEFESTWNNRFATIPWSEGGCQRGNDFVSQPSATAFIDERTFASKGMISDVQSWLSEPAKNFGWILLATDDLIGTGKQVGSREDFDNTPVLTVEYTLPAPVAATATTLFGAIATGGSLIFKFIAQSNQVYAVEFSDTLGPNNWTTLTNFPAQASPKTIRITNSISSNQRYFRVKTP
ncbi:MAG: hypothetical protein JWN25_2648 [Verrucomicrobiales bacterium]|nr:hypothetical protein [Verrucomicrobiales bacterium]